ncbi:hypothetical protein [Shinella kummerowiae]|uniref:hypothetical protein n=1 Tax=Shinella kummerowiae TaxID=417745 RepID=UPI0021B517AC|nr:hypothetical protein [Shinella kummerowiae]MCT7662326.1 hypothetical protein [Shinella kummerowiae]
MARIAGGLKSSLNAGQFAERLLGRVNVKQYYSAAKRMVGIEPVPQSGFQLLPGTRRMGLLIGAAFRKGILKVSPDLSYTLVFSPGRVDIFRSDGVRVVTNLTIGSITADRIPEMNFYGEADTFGVFHPDIPGGVRLVRNASDDTNWTVSTWPFTALPEVDLGGTYTKTPDVWTLYIRWAGTASDLAFTFSVDGQPTGTIALLDTVTGLPADPDDATADWAGLATQIQTALRALPSMNVGVTVALTASANRYRTYTVTFGGTLAGSEYQFDGMVVNTSEASALVSHAEIGKTAGEPLVSTDKGGFSGMELYQDRAVYWAPRARKSAMAMSRTGEYFDLDIEVQADNGARLEALRSDTGEAILHVVDATYLLVFTERGEYFASNRTIKRNEPLNFVRASGIGTRASCRPVVLEGSVYFVSRDGGRLYRTSYDAVTEAFDPQPVNDLNDDLVSGIVDMVVQRKSGLMKSDRIWLLREDGRLVRGAPNIAQEIDFSACEWAVAGGGTVRAIGVDVKDQLWLTVQRGNAITEEIAEEESINLLQCALSVTTDLTGLATGLSQLEGRVVWAMIDNDFHGPFTVTGGQIQTDIPSRPAVVGLWAVPLFESMPYVRVLPNDDVVRRPGKVGSARLYVIETGSIAIGANGRPAKDVPLNRASDNLDGPKKNFTGHLQVAGLIGACMDPTLVITQTRPGRLSVRDYIPGVKL